MYKPGARAAAERTCGWRVGRRNRGGAPGAVVAAAVATTDPRSPEYDGSAIAGGGSGVESRNRAVATFGSALSCLHSRSGPSADLLVPRAHPRGCHVGPPHPISPLKVLTYNIANIGCTHFARREWRSGWSPTLRKCRLTYIYSRLGVIPNQPRKFGCLENLSTPPPWFRGEDMLSSATVRPLAHALRLQTPASRLSASPVRFASSLAGRRRDPHEVLGVLPGVSKCELKKAFHRSSWSWHPDRATPSDRPAAEVRPRMRSKPLAAPPDWSGSAHTACSLSPRPAASLQGAFGGLSQAERPRGWARGTRELAV